MEMTDSNWWFVPLAITGVSLYLAHVYRDDSKGPYEELLAGLINTIQYGLAAVLSMASWLLYFIIF